MKSTKKILSMIVALLLVAALACSALGEGVTVRVGALKGATSMGLVKLLHDSETGESDIACEFTMAAAADELTPLFLQGKLDVLAAPANLAAILYNKTGGAVKFVAINTLGLLYIVEKNGETINALEDLKGRTLYATGKGTTPEYALTYLLSQHGLTLGQDVLVEWKSEPTETIAAMSLEENAVAMLPQPFVTAALASNPDLRVALNLNEEWTALDNGSLFITAGLMVRADFAKEHPEELAAFLKEYQASTQYLNENPTEAAPLVEAAGIVKAAVAEKAIPFCNIAYLDGEEMKTAAQAYYQILFEQNPASVGGTLPGEDFYAY